jgi:Protein of unknown function (DUF692)
LLTHFGLAEIARRAPCSKLCSFASDGKRSAVKATVAPMFRAFSRSLRARPCGILTRAVAVLMAPAIFADATPWAGSGLQATGIPAVFATASPAGELFVGTWVACASPTVTMGSGGGMLLDLHNLCANSVNFGGDPAAFLALLPIETIHQVRISGGKWIDDGDPSHRRPLDDHLHAPPEPATTSSPLVGSHGCHLHGHPCSLKPYANSGDPEARS